MKNRIFLIVLFVISFVFYGYSQTIPKGDSLGLPGDNLNLYAVLDLFQQSETFEIFEKKLNAEDSKINNLDLNNDGKTDYIKVIDHQQGDTHSIVLQVPVNEKENQDVAVIEVEKDKTGKVVVQIVGNEDLYGKDYIVEPQENDPNAKSATASNNSNSTTKSDTTVSANGKTVVVNNTTNNYYGSNGNTASVPQERVYVSVGYWPMVRYIYTPGYVVYSSPWYWYSYPLWWHPWTPWLWHNYYWHHYNYYNHYHGYYHRTGVYRDSNANGYYGPRRTSSAAVQNNREKGMYSQTYSRGLGEKVNPGANPAYRSTGSENKNIRRDGNNSSYQRQTAPASRSKPNYNTPSNSSSRSSRSSAPRSSGVGVPHSRGGGGGGGGHMRSSSGGGRSSGGGGRRR